MRVTQKDRIRPNPDPQHCFTYMYTIGLRDLLGEGVLLYEVGRAGGVGLHLGVQRLQAARTTAYPESGLNSLDPQVKNFTCFRRRMLSSLHKQDRDRS